MNRVYRILVCLLLVGCGTRGGDETSGIQRVRFVPDSAPSSPLESSDGAVWSRLRPFPRSDSEKLGLQAWARVGDRFPVAKRDGPTLFEVFLKEGDDERVSLEILSKQGAKSIEVQRNKSAQVEVAGVTYEFVYPSSYVGSTEERTTTNKAMLIVTTPRQ